MKITKIKTKNYRLLQDFELDLEKELSLIIGKNNCGKTSLLSVLNKFLGKSNSQNFSCNDFNIDFQKQLKTLVETALPNPFPFLGISLKIFIEYTESDNLANISKLMTDLDPENKTIVFFNRRFFYGNEQRVQSL